MEMPGPWKAWKSKSSFSPLSTAPWESRQRREIPTFPQPGMPRMGKWKTKIRFPTFPRGACDDDRGLSVFRTKNQERRSARFAASSITFFRITLDWKRNSVSGSSFDWKMLSRRTTEGHVTRTEDSGKREFTSTACPAWKAIGRSRTSLPRALDAHYQSHASVSLAERALRRTAPRRTAAHALL